MFQVYWLQCVTIDVPGPRLVNTVEVYSCNTYMQTQHHSKTGNWYSWYWIWLKNYLKDIHTWTAPLFAKVEYMISEYIKCTGYNVGISCMVITTCIYVLHSWHKVILYSTKSIDIINVIQTVLKLTQLARIAQVHS